MPRGPKPALPPERRHALEAELRLYAREERRATLEKHIHVSRSYDAGMSLGDIARIYGVSRDTAMRWKDSGERERDRRRSGDPDGPREQGANC